MDKTKEWPIDSFLRWIEEVVRNDDRGVLAELRRGLSVTTQEYAWKHLIRFSADFAENDTHRAVWCAIGGLAAELCPYGLLQREAGNNLGATMRALAIGREAGDESKCLKAFEPKFRRALACWDTQSLCEIVISIGRTAAMQGVPMDLKILFWDLWNWHDIDKRDEVRLKWAKQFFGAFETPSETMPDREGDNE